MKPLVGCLRRLRARISSRCAVTGVGKASAAARTALELVSFRPRITVFLGCAGAYPHSNLVVGDIVVATHEILGDEGVETSSTFLDLERLGLPSVKEGRMRWFDEIPVARPTRVTMGILGARWVGTCAVRTGRLVTVSTSSGTAERALALSRRTGGVAENMEGAGAAIAALMAGHRLFEVRGISNLTGRRDRRAWDIPTACERAAEAAVHLALHELGISP